jgi:bifunctional non-homologous end joining protein LigD
MSLSEYEKKRDFKRTAEPPAGKPRRRAKSRRFVIQKHDASRLHYDFRLELDGTLKSWAVPKGVPFARGDKRLAVHVEDHPVDYADFEGIIPEGQYGGGTVMVWDRGTWESLGGDATRDLASGKLHFALKGEKLKGEWTLVRTRNESGGKEQWLLIKSGSDMKPLSKKRDDESVLSGRTMRKIASDRDHEWQSHRPAGEKETLRERIRKRLLARTAPEPKPRGARTASGSKRTASRSKRAAGVVHSAAAKSSAHARLRSRPAASTKEKQLARFIAPMKARLVSAPPAEGAWVYELKFDGFRALAIKSGAHVDLFSRNANLLTEKFPDVANAVEKLKIRDGIIDGEIVALDSDGRSSFQLLQSYELGDERPPLCYYVFDLLRLEGRDLRGEPLFKRKEELERVLQGAPATIRFSANINGPPRQLLTEVKARGLEGLIGKLRDSTYESGRRSGAWIKLKCVDEQEFVIGGYTPPQGARKYFGALLVGYYEGDRLRFAGKIGTGFNTTLLRVLHARLQKLVRLTAPFADLPEKRAGQWTQNITPAIMRRCTWVEPELVCEAKFTEWTRDGKLRHPVFVGMREDKEGRSVVRERPA